MVRPVAVSARCTIFVVDNLCIDNLPNRPIMGAIVKGGRKGSGSFTAFCHNLLWLASYCGSIRSMSIISVTPSARCQGQTIINTYWYRSAVALPFAELFGWAEAIAAAWADLFWTGDVGTRMQDLLPDDYVLETILVDFRDDDGVLLNTIPYSVAVDLAGGNTGSFDGNHNCAIMHFSLGGAPGPGRDLPRRGYVALGPIVSDAIGDNGVLTGSTLYTFQSLVL